MRDEILHYIIDNTDKETFEKGLKNYDMHYLYSRKKNYLLYKYFGGHNLHYSVYMHELFLAYIPEGTKIKSDELLTKIKELKSQIRVAKKCGKPFNQIAKEHNEILMHYRELMKGIDKLIAIWNKRHKKIKQAA